MVEETDNRANRKTDEIIDAGFDKIEEGIGSIFKKKDKKSAKGTEADTESNDTGEERSADRGKKDAGSGNEREQLALKWNKYDFVPGDN